jgi:hypothetical protein
MVVTLGKKMKTTHGKNNYNILARESFGEEQLKKENMKKFSSPHRKAQQKVCPPIVMQI